jgi:protein-S-isoprenylcysteine O-methyltransferase Ste14
MMIGIQQTILIGISFAAFYILNFVLIAYYDRQRQNPSWKLSYTLMVWISTAILALQPLLLPWLGLRITAGWAIWIQFIGMFIVLCSLLLQLWARLHLGRFYAERAEIQPGHRLIDTGPYAYIRHPLFTSYFMFITGLLLVAPNLLMLLAALYAYWDFSHAAVRDEQIMIQNMPEYASYMVRTTRFFPRPIGQYNKSSHKVGIS